nr:hypothetical protein [Tanacetum cinerariifolium]
MAASAIIISSDSSDESVGSPASRVILFGDIPNVILSTFVIAPETSAIAPVISSAAPVVETTIIASPTGLCGLVPYSNLDSDSPDEMDSPEYITPLPATLPFLFTDSSEDSDPSEASDSSEAPPSQDPYVTTVARWRSKVTTRSSSPSDFPIALVTAPFETRRRAAIRIRPGEAIPLGRPYRTRPNGPQRVMTVRKRVGPLPARRLAWRHVSPRSSDHCPSCFSSPTDSSPVHYLGLDAPGQAHSGYSTRVVSPRLGYPPVRAPRHSEAFRRWCAAPLSTLYPPTTSESSSGGSSERPLHSSSHSAGPSHKRCWSSTDYIPSSALVTGSLASARADLLPPRKRELDVVDGDNDRDHIEVDHRDAREEFKASTGDTIVLGIDSRSVLMVDEEIVEPVGGDSSSSSGTRDGTVRSVEDIPVDLDGAIRDFYHYMSEVRVYRIVGIEATQRQLEADQMIASGERAGMAESIRSLRLENLKIRDDRDNLRGKLRRLESFAERHLTMCCVLCCTTMTNTRSGMTPAAIEEMINRRVAEALEAHEINRNLGLENENGNGNGDGGNGNGNGGNGNGGNGNGQGENGNGDGKGDRPVARECTYQDFMKCQPPNFKGTEGVVCCCALTWWNSQKTIGTDAAYALSWRELMNLMTEVYCPRNEIQKMETELWNLSVKNNDMATYAQRFQELTMMCTKMVPEEEDRVEKFIGENKRRFDTNHRDNRGQQPPFKRQNTRGQNVARAYTAGNNKKRGCEGPLPYCNRWPNQKVVTCFECGAQGNYWKNYPKVKNQNRGNKARVPDVRGKAYVLGGGNANPGSNTVT